MARINWEENDVACPRRVPKRSSSRLLALAVDVGCLVWFTVLDTCGQRAVMIRGRG